MLMFDCVGTSLPFSAGGGGAGAAVVAATLRRQAPSQAQRIAPQPVVMGSGEE